MDDPTPRAKASHPSPAQNDAMLDGERYRAVYFADAFGRIWLYLVLFVPMWFRGLFGFIWQYLIYYNDICNFLVSLVLFGSISFYLHLFGPIYPT